MVQFVFESKKSTFKNNVGEATFKFTKVSESSLDLEVEMKHYVTNTTATFKKYVVLKEAGKFHHYPIKQFAVQGVNVGNLNTVKKYFTNLLGEEGYKEFRSTYLNDYAIHLESALNLQIAGG